MLTLKRRKRAERAQQSHKIAAGQIVSAYRIAEKRITRKNITVTADKIADRAARVSRRVHDANALTAYLHGITVMQQYIRRARGAGNSGEQLCGIEIIVGHQLCIILMNINRCTGRLPKLFQRHHMIKMTVRQQYCIAVQRLTAQPPQYRIAVVSGIDYRAAVTSALSALIEQKITVSTPNAYAVFLYLHSVTSPLRRACRDICGEHRSGLARCIVIKVTGTPHDITFSIMNDYNTKPVGCLYKKRIFYCFSPAEML